MKITKYIQFLIATAISEDLGPAGIDITSDNMVPSGAESSAVIMAKQSGVIAGLDVAKQVFITVDKRIKFSAKVKDGDIAKKGLVLAGIVGPTKSILIAERTALNFLQRLSGIATLTRSYVEKIRPYKCNILDTRKTAPCLRVLEKYAVSAGGGVNHRFGLFDAVLIKGNHIRCCGNKNLPEILEIFRSGAEIEVNSLTQAADAAAGGAKIIMLDNMSLSQIRKAVKLVKKINKKILIEASGGIGLKNIRKIASTGVDRISVGALTHSAPALDLSLKIIESTSRRQS